MKTAKVFLCVAAFLVAISTAAQDTVTESRRNALIRAIEKAAPAVVSINVVEIQRGRAIDPLFREFFNFFDMPRQRYRKVESMGSGFIADKDGHILTNQHVLAGADAIESVTLPDGRELDVEFIAADETTDVAVLRSRAGGLPYIELGNSDQLVTGEWVIAIGNPFGGLIEDPQPTVTVGVVSANHRRVNARVGGGDRLYQDMIQTDAAINPGNSGGPLVNAEGQVIGINTFIFSRTGGSIGLNFAIPINRAKRVADDIKRYGRRRNPWAGFTVQDVRAMEPAFLYNKGISAEYGCLVVDVLRDTPAYKAGLRPGDVITGINGQRITGPMDIDFIIWDLFVGDTATLDVDRQGKSVTISFPIQELTR